MNQYAKQWGKLENELNEAAAQAERAAHALRGVARSIRDGESFEDCWWHPDCQANAFASMVARAKGRHEKLL